MTSQNEDAGAHMDMARGWFTDGWAGHPYGGVEPAGKPVEISDMAIWRFADGKVVEISTLQDQFGLLKQVGFRPAAVHAA